MIIPPPFDRRLPVVGMVHLLPLPGSPRWGGSMEGVVARAREDAHALIEGGVDGLMIENFGDVPFHAGAVPPETISAMTVAIDGVRDVIHGAGPQVEGTGIRTPFGVNVLRNDARSALGIAAATGAAFIRVNVHTGEMHTDQGPIVGRAAETLRARAALPGGPAILADVFVKHATPPAGADLGEAARDLVERGLADGVIVSGSGTGESTPIETLKAVRAAVPRAPIWVGSGVTPESIPALAEFADGLIVGSSLKVGGDVRGAVDPARVSAMMSEARRVADSRG